MTEAVACFAGRGRLGTGERNSGLGTASRSRRTPRCCRGRVARAVRSSSLVEGWLVCRTVSAPVRAVIWFVRKVTRDLTDGEL